MRRQVLVLTAFLLISGSMVRGQLAQIPPVKSIQSQPSSALAFADLEDLIHFGDLIEVDVVGSTEFDWRGELTPAGFLQGLEFTGDPVYGLCKSGEEVGQTVRASYSKFLNSPDVRVSILDRSKRPLALLLGAVRLPQRFRLMKGVSLQQLIVMAGGFTENTRGEVQILRQSGAACTGFSSVEPERAEAIEASKTEARTVSIQNILDGEPGSNPEIYYGDFITVMEAPPVYVIGAVSKPGRVSFTKGLSIRRAIDAAGGPLPDSKSIEIRVFRRNPTGSEVIQVDSTVAAASSTEEFELREYDIVEVFGGRGKMLENPPVLQNSSAGGTQIDSLPIRIVN